MSGTCDGMNFTLSPITVATLPCESQNTENVILQHCRILPKEIASHVSQLHQSGQGIVCLKFTYLGCYSAMRVWNDSRRRRPEENAWCKLRLTMTRTLSMLRLTTGVTDWDHVCMLVVDSLNTYSDINVHLCDFSEHLGWSSYLTCIAHFKM